MGAGGSGANPFWSYRRAEPFRVSRGSAPAARHLNRNKGRPLGRCLAPALLSVRRSQHGRQPLGFLPAHASQERTRPARRGDWVAPARLIRAGVPAEKPGLRAWGGLLVRGPAARRALRPPVDGLAAADRAAAFREVIREVARRLGYRASFAPMADPGGVGNGVHVHMSL